MAPKLIPRFMAGVLLVWAIATAWAMTITGFLEPASLDVDYFEAGAGNSFLRFRLFLALGVALLAALWALVKGSLAARLGRLAIAPCILLLFYLSVAGLNRQSSGFSEAEYLRILDAHLAGRKVSLQDVQRHLGQPLMVARYGDHLQYFYTFTPSGGYGWHKRAFAFDARGNLVDFLNLDEP